MENPFQTSSQSPLTRREEIFQQDRGGDRLEVSSIAQITLFGSKGWVRFISVLGFIFFAIMVMMIFSMLTLFGSLGGSGGIFGLIFLIMIIMTVIIFILSLRLAKFSSSIGRMQMSRSPADLENALIEQMKFWRLTGVLTLVVLALLIISISTAAAASF